MQKRPWILFDIGGVLEVVDDDNWPEEFATRWQRRAGLTPDEYRARLDSIDLPAVDREAGTEPTYWRLVGNALALDAAETRRMRSDLWDAYCGELNVELMEFARSLTARAGVAILSNSIDGAREEEERRYGFSRVFDPICYSHELGVGKPDSAAYERALARMNAVAQDVFFIDDHEAAVTGARAVSIQSIVHQENASTIAAIERFLTEREYAAS